MQKVISKTELEKLYKEKTPAECAEILEVSIPTFYAYLKKAGIELIGKSKIKIA